MDLPADVEFHEDIQLFVHRPHGLLDEAAVNRVVSALGHLEAREPDPFNRFIDTLEAEAVDLNFRYVLHVSLYRRLTYAGRTPVKSAVLATDVTILHYARLHALMTQGSAINVRIFKNRAEAALWLDVPVHRLVPDGREENAA